MKAENFHSWGFVYEFWGIYIYLLLFSSSRFVLSFHFIADVVVGLKLCSTLYKINFAFLCENKKEEEKKKNFFDDT